MNPEPHITHIYWSLTQLNMGIRELQALYQPRANEYELELIEHRMFKIFHLTLKNLVVIEYCKLLENSKLIDGDGNPATENIASVYNFYKHTMQKKSGANKTLSSGLKELKNVVRSPFYLMIKDLRNKKHAHSDNHTIAEPYIVSAFSEDEMKVLDEHFLLLKTLFHNCVNEFENSHYETEAYQSEIEDFIIRYGNQSEYYYKNSKNLK